MHSNGLKLSGALEKVLFTTLQFLSSKMQKKKKFEENKGFECIFMN